MGPRAVRPYVEVLAIGVAAVAAAGLSRAWVVASIALAMTLGVAVAALRR